MHTAIQYKPDENGKFIPVGIVDTAGADPVPIDDPAALRQLAYIAEADVFRDQAVSYDAEAKALAEEGDEQAAHTATAKAVQARANYIAKKREIRERYPDAAAPK